MKKIVAAAALLLSALTSRAEVFPIGSYTCEGRDMNILYSCDTGTDMLLLEVLCEDRRDIGYMVFRGGEIAALREAMTLIGQDFETLKELDPVRPEGNTMVVYGEDLPEAMPSYALYWSNDRGKWSKWNASTSEAGPTMRFLSREDGRKVVASRGDVASEDRSIESQKWLLLLEDEAAFRSITGAISDENVTACQRRTAAGRDIAQKQEKVWIRVF